MKNLMQKVNKLAGEEAAKGNCVMVLFPSSLWVCKAHQYLDNLGGPKNGVHIRYSNQHCSLISLPVNVLILVATDEPEWSAHGLLLALDKVQVRLGKIIPLCLEKTND
jgi:hypothetical protein